MLNFPSMVTHPKIAIIYLSYHSDPYLDDVVSGLKKITYPHDRIEFVIVDNPHPKHGPSVRYIEEYIMPLSRKEIPHVTLLPQKENLGFAGGNNAGVRWALDNGFDYIYFHNQDGFMATNALEPMVTAMERDRTIGIAQSFLLLYPETDLVNCTGNSFQYLGFGFCDQYRKPAAELDLPPVKEISYASGAAFMVSVQTIRQFGMWDEDFFLYHEDMEWSFRLRAIGKKIVMIRDSVFYHKYQFARSIEKFYWMERNRYGVMLMFFRMPTLILLLPALIGLEIGLWLFSIVNAYSDKRVAVYKYWLNANHWKLWLEKRRRIQRMRTVSDRYLMSYAVSGIYFQDASVNNPIVNYIANPAMAVYYWLVVRGLIWW